MTRVKICGVTNLRDLRAIAVLGADAVGVITGIPSSSRNVSPEVAKTLLSKTPVFTKSVLVMAPRNLEEAIEVCDYVKPDAVQIHGGNIDMRDFSMAIQNIDVIKPLSANVPDVINTALDAADLYDAILLDSSTSTELGGTGKIHDWIVSRQIAEAIKPKSLILAGGLNSDNVIEAINTVKPYAVDVCTGTEVNPGIKDLKKVQLFLSMVKKADRNYLV